MAKSNNKQKAFFWAGLVLCLCVATGGGVLYKTKHGAAIAAQDVALIAKQKAWKARKVEIQALFDTYLNNFTNELIQKARNYKKSRLLLKKITKPIDYETEEFSKQNYILFKEELAPSLRAQGEDIINLFGRYSEKIHNELEGDKGALQQTFLIQWNDMTKKQLDHYITLFMREEEIIQAYDALITFYYTHARRYYIDVENNKFVFSDPKDTEKALILLERIENLQKKPATKKK